MTIIHKHNHGKHLLIDCRLNTRAAIIHQDHVRRYSHHLSADQGGAAGASFLLVDILIIICEIMLLTVNVVVSNANNIFGSLF